MQDTIIALGDEVAKGNKVGLDVATGEPLDPVLAGIYDNLLVKRQMLQSAPVVASQLLLVDEVCRPVLSSSQLRPSHTSRLIECFQPHCLIGAASLTAEPVDLHVI